MISAFLRTLCAFVLVSLLVACASQMTVPSAKLGEKYRKDFNSALRWKQYKVAASHMQPELRSEFLAIFDELKDIHIVDVRVVDAQSFDENSRFETTLEMDYYLLPSVTVKTFRFDQSWEFQGSEEQPQRGYSIVSPFPEFP